MGTLRFGWTDDMMIDDAQALLRQVSMVDPRMHDGSKVFPVALNKLKVNGMAFRLILEQSQIKNVL
ncbi:hypothetical protein Ahy_A07g033028 [Arachis hypogaea]|uniref:Uncharacterized protein n=1 Tax=Arachis hypogaea TaxID=3818 RepID=A0A445C834_ARAHY|nr:hypothetical protein Ahy_A07g033028 [Arachis hypogaea]